MRLLRISQQQLQMWTPARHVWTAGQRGLFRLISMRIFSRRRRRGRSMTSAGEMYVSAHLVCRFFV